MERLYRQEGRRYLTKRVNYYSEKMDVTYNQTQIRNQRTRWAGSSPKRILTFNFRLMMLPPDVIDYIVVHELAHFIEKNHTKRFWRLVKKYIPNYKEKAEWMEKNSSKFIFTEEDL